MRRDNQTGFGLRGQCRDAIFDLIPVVNGKWKHLYRKCTGGCFCRPEEPDVGRCIRMEDKPDAFDLRCNLVQYLEPLTTDRVLVIGETRGVPAGPFDAGRKATADWITDKHEYDGYAASLMQQDV